MAFYISGPKLLFETTEISIHPNSTQQEWNYIYLYTTKFGTSIKIWLNRKFESTEFETMRVNCIIETNKNNDLLQSPVRQMNILYILDLNHWPIEHVGVTMVTTRMKIIIVKDGTCHRTCHGSIRQRHRQEVKHDMDMCTPTVEEGMYRT
jgi:hypothetical protein